MHLDTTKEDRNGHLIKTLWLLIYDKLVAAVMRVIAIG